MAICLDPVRALGRQAAVILWQLLPRMGRDVYADFNNDWQGFAVREALRLRKLLE